jgi:peroxiredoxin
MSAGGLLVRVSSVVLANLFISIRLFAAGVGDSAPEFTLPGLVGDEIVASADYRGKVVYLDFWASWCKPCRQSFPWLAKLHREIKNQGFEVVAINVDDRPDAGREFLDSYPVKYAVASDHKGLVTGRYKVEGLPTAFLLDRDGKVRHVHKGFKARDMAYLGALIQVLLETTSE